nr:HAD hydrolase family protein [Megamonas funiformis]
MLSTVGMGMAMANGSVKARNSAKIVVPSVFEDGVAYGIERYILSK